MSISTRLVHRVICLLALPAALLGQATSITPVPSGKTLTTENSLAVSGVQIKPMPDRTVWFLIPSNDRIVQLQADGVTFKQWQIRPDNQLGANPVDFQIDGNLVWFIENGESQIDAGYSALGRLDTQSGQLREWVIPGSRPANFWRAPDGNTVWIPQTNGRLQSLDLTTLQVVDYRSSSADGLTYTFAYSDGVLGPDGALWMTDFGNNRIVRYVPGAASETSWTIFDPNTARLNPSQIQFDDQGMLWISEFSAARMDRFNPATSALVSYNYFTDPIHFDIFNGRVYVADATGGNGIVTVLDPGLAAGIVTTLTPATLSTKSIVNPLATTIRDSTITPTNFTSTTASFASSDVAVNTGLGYVSMTFPDTNAYGISATGGGVWVGTNGFLAQLTLQSVGTPADLSVPFAAQSLGAGITIDLTLSNRGSAAISGNALLMTSPASSPSQVSFSVDPGATVLLPDAFHATSTKRLTFGPIRFQVTAGNATDLVASARTNEARPDGSSSGFSFPAQAGSEILGAGTSRTLFTSARDAAISVLGFYAPEPASATATLLAPDGAVRGTLLVSLDKNVAEEFNQAASGFGVTPEAGDVVRVTVNSGSIQPYVNVLDGGTSDVASSTPVAATKEAIIPNVGTVTGSAGASFVSDLLVSNTDPANPAHLLVSFAPLGSSQAPLLTTLTLPPNGSQTIADVLPTLFSIAQGQGALGVSSDVPVAVSTRVAARLTAGDLATFAPAFDVAEAIAGGGAAFAIGTPQTATRRTHLLLHNDGSAGTVTVIGYDGSGNEVGRLAVPVAARQPARVNSVFAQLNVSDQAVGRIRIETTPGMRVYAETAEVDASGDLEIAKMITSP